MRKLFLFLILLSAATAKSADIRELAEYVYPNNATASAALNFMPDGQTYLKLSADGKTISRYDVASGKLMETIFDAAKTRGDKLDCIADYTVSPDGSLLLVYKEKEQIYRRTFRAAYYIFDIRRNTLKPLSAAHPMQQSPLVSPDGRMVAFMGKDNNIYIHKVDYGSEVAVTTDGKINEIINGVPDWVYEEEFSTNRSMEWAPDNSTLCYLKYDESRVPAFSFTEYEGACNPKTQYALYPGEYTYKYPVAGEPNSKVTLHSYDVETRKTKELTLPAQDIEYIPRIHFDATGDQLIALALNREQNRLDFYSVNPRSTVAKLIHQEKSSAWVRPETYESVSYLNDGMVLFSDRTGWSQLYKIDYNGNDLGPLTQGDFDVTAFYGYSPDGSYYYQSTANGPINRIITKVNPRKKTSAIVSDPAGWAAATFAPGGEHYILSHSSATQAPKYTLVAAAKDQTLRTLEENAAVQANFASAPKREFFQVGDLNAYIVKPADFSQAKTYPVVVSQYSGPGSQEVVNRWSIDWPQYFAQQGFVVVCVDGRGTGGRGRQFEQCVYKNLGAAETQSQLQLVAWLKTQPWAGKIGIYGWSFGGYESLMAASASKDYAAAVAVAPVTSWRYYDTIYAERYMSTPQANAEGYDVSAPINRIAGFKCPLLLIHGTADDNVHLSNTIELTARLLQAGKMPEMLLFPNMNHSINGCNTRALVYARMFDFFNARLR